MGLIILLLVVVVAVVVFLAFLKAKGRVALAIWLGPSTQKNLSRNLSKFSISALFKLYQSILSLPKFSFLVCSASKKATTIRLCLTASTA